jgi:hypothetical protein
VSLKAFKNGLQRQNNTRNPAVKQAPTAKNSEPQAKQQEKQEFFSSL